MLRLALAPLERALVDAALAFLLGMELWLN
jgi:hypothetical protein